MVKPAVSSDRQPEPPRKFGTFLGVFTPSILTVLGVIMYLRFGWVLASVGLAGALAIVLICSAVAIVTALSASAVATNMPLGVGGEYFLVSRSLGLHIGGAIGIPLFLCRILSVTLYCFGLAEVLAMFWPAEWGPPPIQYLAAGLIAATILISGRSASATLKLQIPLMALVGLSLMVLAAGVATGSLRAPEWFVPNARTAAAGGFWAVLAVYFPAITGFNAGIGMSGDLKDPQRSIPRGVVWAVVVGTLVYLAVPFLLAISGKVTVDQLADIRPQAPSVWSLIALGGGLLVFPGMAAAILSSAFGSALAGPRVLQALAKDRLAPRVLARTSKTGQPTLATWVGGVIALAAVALGDLNNVALVVTIFFLTLYMSINLVAAVENLVADPSYRPTIRIHWGLSLLGAAGNLLLMFLISPWACAAAIALELLLWLYLRERALKAHWGSVWAGIWGTVARLALRKLDAQPDVPRSWRPNILLFADAIEERPGLLAMASWFNKNRGTMTVCEVLSGPDDKAGQEVRRREAAMTEWMSRHAVEAYAEAHWANDLEAGILGIAQANGIGPLRSNTVVFGWPGNPERLAGVLKMIRSLYHLGMPTLIVRPNPPRGPQEHERIDVWWRGRENCGDLMLLLAHLLTLDAPWRAGQITLRSVVDDETARGQAERALEELVASVRIAARRDVIVRAAEESVSDIIRRTSRNADVVFMGLMVPEAGQEQAYVHRLVDLVGDLPTTVLVRNGGPFAGRLI